MKILVTSFLFCALVSLAARPARPQAGQPERRVSDANGAYSFTAPAGFDSQQSDEGFALVNGARTFLVAVKAHDFQTFEQFAAQANLERDGLTLAGKVQDVGRTGKTFRVTKQTSQGVAVVDTFVLFSPHGGGLLVVAISDAANSEEGFRAALRIAESVAFSKPQASEVARQVESVLRGKQLIYFYNGNGYSERKEIYLCPSGGFFFRTDATSNSNLGSGGFASGADGDWKVVSRGGLTLLLQFRSGATHEYKISARQASNEIGLDGKRYFVKPFGGCPK